MSECPVCCDKYTSHLRKVVQCPYCEYSSCNVCVKKYLTNGLLDAHCMGCRRGWNDEFLDLNFTKAFRTGAYKKHREDVLLDREIGLLPSRQPRVEAKVKMRDVESNIKVVNDELFEWEKKRQVLLKKSAVLTRSLTRYMAESEGRAPPAWTLGEGEKTAERAKFIMKCPDSECRGFLSSAYKCGTCQKWSCPDCLVVKGKDKDAEHTCDPGQKDSVALIIKESKPCPKCGERISKIDGCDQMWCIDCHTAFSWATGAIVNGIVHNPHYYEFLRKQGGGAAPRNAGDVPCGGVPYYHHLHQNITQVDKPTQGIIMNIHRITSEIADQRIIVYQGHFNVNDNGDLGVQYLLKEISKDEMKIQLAKREIKRNKHLAIRAILEMFVNTSTMMLNNIVSHPPGEKLKEELRKLKEESKILTVDHATAIKDLQTHEIASDNQKVIDIKKDQVKEILKRHIALKNKIANLETESATIVKQEIEPIIIAYNNLRTYVNDSLMGVSRMKNCSVPQISALWTWMPFNKVGPKARAEKIDVPAPVE